MGKRQRKQLPTDEFTTKTTGLSHEGRGIAHVDGKTTFLFGALANETVKFIYTSQRGRFDEGDTTQVILPAPDRTTPACVHFGICGGCSLQHMRHDFQIEQKQKAFLELLKHQANIIPETLLPPIVGDIWGYRRKARIGIKFVPQKDKVVVGFRERKGRYIANLHSCEVLHPSVGKKIEALSQCLMQLETRRECPQLEVAIDDTTTAVILRHLKPLPATDLEILEAFCQTHQWQLYLQPGNADSIILQYPKEANPLLCYHLPSFDLHLQFKPAQFTQINASINEQMIKQAIHLLDLSPKDHVLDLFCGIGNFSLPMARHSAHVVGIEGDLSSVTQAQLNMQSNQLFNCEFFSADLFQGTYNNDWSQRQYDKILLDPPRAGALTIVQNIKQWQANRIVYVSCNPATLARDAMHLQEQGYRLRAAGILDMFPHTQHVEAITLFEM